jgi:two-component system NarL family response regulator
VTNLDILIVDVHSAILENLKNFLLTQGFSVSNSSTNGTEVLNKLKELLPDVILVDIMMEHSSGFQTTRLEKERFPDTEIPFGRTPAAKALQEFKKNDYTYAGNYVSSNKQKGDRTGTLSARQKEILTLVAKGVKYKDIASALYITERTVKYHMEMILDKLHLENRSQAVKYIIQDGFID